MSFDEQSSAPKSVGEQGRSKRSQEAKEPAVVADRISYGEVIEVKDGQVKVQLFGQEDLKGNARTVGYDKFIPVATDLETINKLYGGLKKGLKVMVHWKGKHREKWAVAHVIAGEKSKFGKEPKQVQKTSMISTGILELFKGGGGVK